MNSDRSQRWDTASSSAVLQCFDLALREAVMQIPLAPLPMADLLAEFDAWNSLKDRETQLPLALSVLRREVFHAPGRDAELRQLWRTALATATAAWQLAQGQAGIAAQAALGGLLYRVGAARLFAVVAEQEAVTGLRLHATMRRHLEAVHEAPLRDALLDSWQVPRLAAIAAREWRAALDEPSVAGVGPLIYLAQLLASEALQPQFCPPTLANGVAERFRISAGRLQAARSALSLLG